MTRGVCRLMRFQRALWNLLAVLLQSRGGQLSDEKLQVAADKACLDARACPQASKRAPGVAG